ncbi:hypothetical protein [Nocardia sp. Root136]|uniref:hypothetical protein n=3 Tax=Nocardia TaxID=1817 RepID=UPI000B041805|nr:hypothetical protein [Nocardia sp. Root136]
MQMKTVFNSMTIDLADDDQSLALLHISDIDEAKWDRVKCLALKSTGVDSSVACASFSIRVYPHGFPTVAAKSGNAI